MGAIHLLRKTICGVRIHMVTFLELNRKRKYIPETENYDNDETQCENEEETLSNIFEQHSQS